MAESMEGKIDEIGSSAGNPYLNDLLPALKRLDHLLEGAVNAAKATYGPEATADPYQGLYISTSQVEQLLSREPGTPTLHTDDKQIEAPFADLIDGISGLAWLKRVFGLSPFDVDIILIALAAELDLRSLTPDIAQAAEESLEDVSAVARSAQASLAA